MARCWKHLFFVKYQEKLDLTCSSLLNSNALLNDHYTLPFPVIRDYLVYVNELEVPEVVGQLILMDEVIHSVRGIWIFSHDCVIEVAKFQEALSPLCQGPWYEIVQRYGP